MKKGMKCFIAAGLSITMIFGSAASVSAQTTSSGSAVKISAEGPGVTVSNSKTGSYTTSEGSTNVAKPTVQAQGAALLDATTNTWLFGKNENTKLYPASITKIMTALLVAENCDLSETVTFSKAATTNLESGAVTLSLTEGDQLTVEQCLYGLLLKSANEIGNGLAEHVSGSVSAFADKMNQKAVSLGCTNTHFANPHGLNDNNHYTTAHDMALIGKAAFQNSIVRKVDSSTSYLFPATKLAAARTITMGHKMFYSTDSRYYSGIVGGKTGYTSKAGNTLVTAVEKNGHLLIAVVMKAAGTHYTDTKALLDYGFAVVGQNASQQTAGQTAETLPSNTENTTQSPAPTQSQSPAPTQSQSPAPTQSSVPTETQASPDYSNPTQTRTEQIKGPGTVYLNPASNERNKWIQDGTGWYYIKSNGQKAASECLTIDGETYCFSSNTYMITGWSKMSDGNWYYFKSSGAMAKNYWAKDNNQWFYLGNSGAMLKDTVTPDGYRVGSDGAWIE